jgi:hypothetical protein
MLLGPFQSVPPRPGKIVGGSFTPPLIEPASAGSGGVLQTVQARVGDVPLALGSNSLVPAGLSLVVAAGQKVSLQATCELGTPIAHEQGIHMTIEDDLGNVLDVTDPSASENVQVWTRIVIDTPSPGTRTYLLKARPTLDATASAFSINFIVQLLGN